jgi:hypothetical protein
VLALADGIDRVLEVGDDYRTHTGLYVTVSPQDPPTDAFIHVLY